VVRKGGNRVERRLGESMRHVTKKKKRGDLDRGKASHLTKVISPGESTRKDARLYLTKSASRGEPKQQEGKVREKRKHDSA